MCVFQVCDSNMFMKLWLSKKILSITVFEGRIGWCTWYHPLSFTPVPLLGVCECSRVCFRAPTKHHIVHHVSNRKSYHWIKWSMASRPISEGNVILHNLPTTDQDWSSFRNIFPHNGWRFIWHLPVRGNGCLSQVVRKKLTQTSASHMAIIYRFISKCIQ